MKKYIAPIAEMYEVLPEGVMALSNIGGEGSGEDLSNTRDASSSIWDTEN